MKAHAQTATVAGLWFEALYCCGALAAGSADPATCRAIQDSAQRLACYDQATAPAQAPGPTPLPAVVPAAPAPAPAPASAPMASPTPAPAVAPAAPSVAVPAAPLQAPPAAAVVDQFGLDERQLIQSGRAEKAPALALKSISGLIAHVGYRANGEFVVTLDNGQVWEQIEMDTLSQVRDGDKVLIRRGVLGSFLLVTPNRESTRVHRVR